MKLIRAWPRPEINPLDNIALESDADENAAISHVVGFATDLIAGLPVERWRVSYAEDRISIAPKKGLYISTVDIPSIVMACLKADYWVVLRDDSCRFLQAGGDYYFYFGLAFDDAVPEAREHLVLVQDVSLDLIETDFFDN